MATKTNPAAGTTSAASVPAPAAPEKGTLCEYTNGKGEKKTYAFAHTGKNGTSTVYYIRPVNPDGTFGDVIKEPMTHTEFARCKFVANTGKSAYIASFKDAVSANTRSAWQIGDLALQRDRYGLTLDQLADAVGMQEASLNVYASVCKAYPSAERFANLSMTHHQACQGNPNRKVLLQQAIDESWTVRTLKEKARESKTSPAGRKARTPSAVANKGTASTGQTTGNQTTNQSGLTPAPGGNVVPQTPVAPLTGGTKDAWQEGLRIVLSAELSAEIHKLVGGGYTAAQEMAEKMIRTHMTGKPITAAQTPAQTTQPAKPVTNGKPAKPAAQTVQTAPGRFGNLELGPVPAAA